LNAPHRQTGRRLALLAATVAAAAGLAGCAHDSLLAKHEPAAPPAPKACEAAAPDSPMPMLGCANRANLAAMVANPGDLEQGRLLGPASGAHEAQAVDAYKTGKVKPLSGSAGTSLITGEK
jgi:type IV pilus biogenesis protein CpaD/CtpE